MSIQGQGDRWLAGETIEGIRFHHHADVEIVVGARAGQIGLVLFLMNLDDDPLYLVRLRSGAGEVRVRQSALRSVIPASSPSSTHEGESR